jgi:cytochrome c peroxidase
MSNDYVGYAVTNLPDHFATGPVAAANNTPLDNPITNAGATLGRVLFYDKRLSHNDSTSCSSCHRQENDFSDPHQFSSGFEGGLTGRHSMGLSNGTYYARGKFFWDERAATLEDQALQPIQNAVEMGSNLAQLRSELAATNFYPVLFQAAFGTSEITDDRIAKAIAQFVRSMVSYQSKYDSAFAAGSPGAPDFDAVFTEQELLGQEIFHGAGKCSLCHTTDAQVGDNIHNIGLESDNTADVGAGDGRFKTPSLRNVEARGGYMHDGRFTTLEEVIDFYSTDIQANPNLDNRLKANGLPIQFNFTQMEKDAIAAFLETLTDATVLTSELFSDPFVNLPGDFNGDGLVDGGDLADWELSFSLDDGADADGDGSSDGLDFLAWQRNLGTSWQDLSPPLSTPLAVPEPAAAVLTWIGLWHILLIRRRAARGDYSLGRVLAAVR